MTATQGFRACTQIALFDMDRTLVNRHTAKLYVRFLRDCGEMSTWESLRIGYWLLQYTLGLVNAERVALYLLKDYRGKNSRWLHERCQGWFESYVQQHISPVGHQRVTQHLAAGHQVALATSAARHTAQPLADLLQIPHVICSELEEQSHILTGNFCPPLCYGQGKLQRAESLLAELGFDLRQAAFYTDSITDLPLLEKVGEPIVINPDFRLRRRARSRGWPIELWP